MQRILSISVLILTVMVLFGCGEKNDPVHCDELPTEAWFQVNGTRFSELDETAWLRSGAQNSLNFMQQDMQGRQHVVIVIFNGTKAGEYALLGVNDVNRAAYFAPGINGSVFSDSIVPGTLTVTDFQTDPFCLSGHYSFAVDTLAVWGRFQGLRPN